MGNHNSGRRPQPTALKMLRGNPSKTRPNAFEPQPPTDAVVKPDTLTVRAGEVWERLAPVCLHMGTLTVADVPAFVRLCELEATALEISRQKDTPGFAMFTEEYGIHGAIRAERETATTLRPYYEYFGMTPASRARIQVPKGIEAPVSKWAGLLK